jgi:hypothetical protein
MSKIIKKSITAGVFSGLIAICVAVTGSSAFAHSGQTGLSVIVPDKVEWGLTFYTGPDGIVYLLGLDGRLMNKWGTSADDIVRAKPVFDPGGDILALVEPIIIENYLIPVSQKMVQFDVDGNRYFEWAGFELSRGEFRGLHHDFQRLPNGNTLIICLAYVEEPSISPFPLLDDCLIEVDWKGNIVWEWYTYEHFDEFGFTDEARQGIAAAAGDWAHANSVSIIPDNSHADPAFTPGNIMVSYRELNTVIIIDRQTGDIVWKMGPNDSQTIGQHDAYMIGSDRPGAGNIMVFDNGLSAGYPPVSRAFSQVLEIDPVTRAVMWRYNAAYSGYQPWYFFSPIVSGAQRLVNGNTIITEGTKGRLFEVTAEGDIVWEYYNPYFDTSGGPNGPVKNYSVYRAYRMPLYWGWRNIPPM